MDVIKELAGVSFPPVFGECTEVVGIDNFSSGEFVRRPVTGEGSDNFLAIHLLPKPTYVYMPIENYGVLAGTVINMMDSATAQEKDPTGKPHYHVEVSDGNQFYRAAVNVLSDNNPPDLQFYLDPNFQHPILEIVKGLTLGLTSLKSASGTGALDYLKEDLVDVSKMSIVPPMDGSAGENLDDIMNGCFGEAQKSPGAIAYFFGSTFLDKGRSDEFFGFTPDYGIHNVHMNQGSTGSFADENGAYQDGAVFIHFPGKGTWTAMFIKFQSQVVSQ